MPSTMRKSLSQKIFGGKKASIKESVDSKDSQKIVVEEVKAKTIEEKIEADLQEAEEVVAAEEMVAEPTVASPAAVPAAVAKEGWLAEVAPQLATHHSIFDVVLNQPKPAAVAATSAPVAAPEPPARKAMPKAVVHKEGSSTMVKGLLLLLLLTPMLAALYFYVTFPAEEPLAPVAVTPPPRKLCLGKLCLGK